MPQTLKRVCGASANVLIDFAILPKIGIGTLPEEFQRMLSQTLLIGIFGELTGYLSHPVPKNTKGIATDLAWTRS